MIFKCKNCGGNSLYNPEKKMMQCPHCESEDSQEKLAGVGLTQCGNCGAPMNVPDYASAMKCETVAVIMYLRNVSVGSMRLI